MGHVKGSSTSPRGVVHGHQSTDTRTVQERHPPKIDLDHRTGM
jgi:hypothetical protein